MSKMRKRMGKQSRESTNMPSMQESILERTKKNKERWKQMNRSGEVAKCFRDGDVRCIKAITGIMQAVTEQETYSDEMDCLRRMLEAATIMEDDE
jgi:uncharacterized pyridoxamine 5'-phosphate oxidase family protein